jgi:hypothetical protein
MHAVAVAVVLDDDIPLLEPFSELNEWALSGIIILYF